MCAVKLLTIHALRVGAVHATTVEELIEVTIMRRDRTIQWVNPDQPVLCRLQDGALVLGEPAGNHQVNDTVNRLSLNAGVMEKLRPHDLRRGSIRDVSHLKKRGNLGFADAATAASAGHSMKTFMNDVTEDYNGGSNVSIWSLRAESDFRDSRAPKVASGGFKVKRIKAMRSMNTARRRAGISL